MGGQSFGLGGGESSSSTRPGIPTQTGQELLGLIKGLLGETDELRGTLVDQMTEALQTGGIGAQIPLINRAVDASARATGGALQNIESDLSQSGLAGTPFCEAILAQTSSQGKFDQSQIPLGFMTEMFKSIPQYLTALTQSGIAGFGAAAGAEAGNQPTDSKGYDFNTSGGTTK